MKFTIVQINEHHQKVKSGANFPKYIHAIKGFGVDYYIAYIDNGEIKYFDKENEYVSTGAEYDVLYISEHLDLENFKVRLKLHQQGITDYFTFCQDCAKNGDDILKETIPLI